MSAVDVARQVRDYIDANGPEQMGMVREMIREAGVEPGVHVGVPAEAFTPRMSAEWWLGQVAQVIDGQVWIAMNSLLNGFDSLVGAP